MAKGRKPSSGDRPDRLLGTYGYAAGQPTNHDLPDLGEDDVWSSVTAGGSADTSDAYRPMEPPRAPFIDRSAGWVDRQVGGLSFAFEDGYRDPSSTVLRQFRHHQHRVATSAPVDVPDWSRIMRTESTEPPEDNQGDWLPPHEYLAREHGKSVAMSVFEGVGRTLKGRDMSRVRDAVWSQTGFFG